MLWEVSGQILEPMPESIGYNTREVGTDAVFTKDLGGIADTKVGPDGYLYVLSIGKGTKYRIVHSQG